MQYKGYEITAEVETYETWTVDENGNPVELVENANGSEVTGYHYENDVTSDSFFESVSASDMDCHKQIIDDHIKELAA